MAVKTEVRELVYLFCVSVSFSNVLSSRFSLSECRECVWNHFIAVMPGSVVGGRPWLAQVAFAHIPHCAAVSMDF